MVRVGGHIIQNDLYSGDDDDDDDDVNCLPV